MELSKQYDPKESEKKWQLFWENEKVYSFDPNSKSEIYSVDTPPPTVSGKMHMGHAFSYTQQDFIIRFQRMLGKNIFYPFGTDDNGLATERLIEKIKKVKGSKMDRREFVKLCLDTLENELRPQYISDWKRIGISCDFNIFYTTINEHCQRISQRSFIDLFNDKRIIRKKAPIMICPQCSTAIAQVEMRDEQKQSTLNYIKAKLETKDFVIFATTRPEVLPACIGMSLNESGIYVKAKKDKETWILSKECFEKFKDKWNLILKEEIKGKEIVGKKVTLPISQASIILVHDPESKTEYGTGIVYWCTYGGTECMDYITRHEGIVPIDIMDISGKYNEKAGKYKGLNSNEARKQILEDMENEGSLVLMEPLTHAVNVHERCGADIEYVATEQWFIKYLDLKEKLLEAGSKLNWYPQHMKVRYDNWILGLKWDWCISRQRFFGVPFPVWYCKNCNNVILADKEKLPVDPLKDKPNKKCTCGSSEFIGEKDILDTWATSSLTPQLAIELFKDKPIYKKLFPMSLRPQAHDIITFWLFNTVVKSQLHFNKNPWKDVVISGHALDPHGKKMSKSKGNVVEPQAVIEKYSADALRFWAAGSKLGDDLPYMEKDIITGQKFITKLWNAAKFCFMHLEDFKNKKVELEIIDKWLLSKLTYVIQYSTESFQKYEYVRTKSEVENFFWHTFCDYYLETVKDRLYNPDKRGKKARESAQYTLYHSLLTMLKLIAPIMPYITEELYQSFYKDKEKKKSIHTAQWPIVIEKNIDKEAELIGDEFVKILGYVRKYKAEKQISMKTELEKIIVKSNIDLSLVLEDMKATTRSKEIVVEKGEFSVEVV